MRSCAQDDRGREYGFPAGSVGLAAGMFELAEFGWIDLWPVLILGP
jgi:hypothetical protein